jgi:hypothetical protein
MRRASIGLLMFAGVTGLIKAFRFSARGSSVSCDRANDQAGLVSMVYRVGFCITAPVLR